jgi:hypothetical protein
MKVCSKCNIEKPKTEFYKENRSKEKVQSMCKACFKKWQQSDAGKISSRRAHLSAKYNITLQDYDDLLITQNNCCAICGENVENCEKGSGNRLAVDHCHITGKVRGLLCSSCNILLGKAKDNISILQSAINYLTVKR